VGRRRWREPSADDLIGGLDGPIYRPNGRGPVQRDPRSVGWGGVDPVESISLGYLVGRKYDRVTVETDRDIDREYRSPDSVRALTLLAMDLSNDYWERFPARLSLRHFKIRIPVHGRERTFTAFTCGTAAVAYAKVRDRLVWVRCSSKRLRQLSLAHEDPEQLHAFLTAHIEEVGRLSLGEPTARSDSAAQLNASS
jgi:hypothetical protein